MPLPMSRWRGLQQLRCALCIFVLLVEGVGKMRVGRVAIEAA